MTDFNVVLPKTTEEGQRDMNIAYNQAFEDLKKALLNDKFISKFYGVCEKIVKILAKLYK